MTYEIQNSRASAALTDAFDLKGRVRPELEEFIVPVVSVGDLAAGSPPAIQRTATAYFSQIAVSGQRACFQFIVPGGTVAVIKRVQFYGIVSATDAWFLLFSAASAALGKPANQATMSFTDGRLQQTGVEPSCQLWSGTKVSTLNADWAIPQFAPIDATYSSAECVYQPTSGWVVGSGKLGVSSYLEGAFDGTNMAQAGVLEWEEFQVG